MSDDLREIDDDAVVATAIRLASELRENPWLGERMRVRVRERYNQGVLASCRRILFDAPGKEGKPRYRLLYRNEPEDGAPELARLIAVGTRESLGTYRAAATRLGGAQRQKPRR